MFIQQMQHLCENQILSELVLQIYFNKMKSTVLNYVWTSHNK